MVLSLVQSRMVLSQCLTGLTLFLCKNKKTVLLLFKAEIYAVVGRYPLSLSLSHTHRGAGFHAELYIYTHFHRESKTLGGSMQGRQNALKD
jgi:hypothetical protein